MPKKLKEINYDEMEAKPKKTKKAEIDYDKMEREETLAKAKKTAQREKIKAFLMKVIEKKKQKKILSRPVSEDEILENLKDSFLDAHRIAENKNETQFFRQKAREDRRAYENELREKYNLEFMAPNKFVSVAKPSPKPQPKIASVEDSSLDLAIQKARADFLKVKGKVKKGKTEKGYKHRTTATHDEEKELIKLIAKKYKLKKGSVVDEATRDEIEYLLTKEKSPSVKGKTKKGVPMSGNFVVSLTTNNLDFRPVEGI